MSNTIVSHKSGGEAVETGGGANPLAIQSPEFTPIETNPLGRIAGSYADDPNWPEFLQALEASRRELDEAVGSA